MQDEARLSDAGASPFAASLIVAVAGSVAAWIAQPLEHKLWQLGDALGPISEWLVSDVVLVAPLTCVHDRDSPAARSAERRLRVKRARRRVE
jgi:hypothetical protein